MDYSERGSHACTRYVSHTVYLAHENSNLARMKQEEETDTRIIVKDSMKYGRKERGHEREKSQTRPN